MNLSFSTNKCVWFMTSNVYHQICIENDFQIYFLSNVRNTIPHHNYSVSNQIDGLIYKTIHWSLCLCYTDLIRKAQELCIVGHGRVNNFNIYHILKHMFVNMNVLNFKLKLIDFFVVAHFRIKYVHMTHRSKIMMSIINSFRNGSDRV